MSGYQYTVRREAPAYRLSDLWPVALATASTANAYSADLHAADNAVRQFAHLGANWDGYGALPIGEDTVLNAVSAIHVLALLGTIPDVTPNPNGTVSFEWETSEGNAHLEIGKTRYSFYARPSVGRAVVSEGVTSQLPSNLNAIAAVISATVYPDQLPTTSITPTFFVAINERPLRQRT
jgi:hypothetical protein